MIIISAVGPNSNIYVSFLDVTHSHSVSEEITPDNVHTHSFKNFPDNDDSDDDKTDVSNSVMR